MRIKTLLAGAVAALALTGPALAQDVAITGGRVLTGTSVIENGTVVIRNGKVVSVGTGGAPAGLRVIDARGKIVTPGFVAVDSGLAGTEVGSVRGTNDLANRANTLTAAFDLSYGLDPWSFTLPVARLGGVTRAVVTPQHGGSGGGHSHDDSDFAGAGHGGFQSPGLFAGQAAVIKLGGADILVKPRVAMVAPFGEAGATVAGGARGAEFVLFKETLAEVRAYARNKAAYERADMRALSLSRADMEALIPVANGAMPLIVTVNRASDIQQVLRLAREEGVKVILDGAAEGWLVADEIAAAKVPVILHPTTNLPSNFEMRAARMQNAAALNAAGVVIAIKGNEGSAHRARDIRYNAGNAVSHGLPFAAAIQAITVNPARIFGFDGQFGELKAGAAGDVVVWSGDPLEPLSQPSAVLIDGVEQPLQARNLLLRDRYRTGGEGAMPPAYGD
ncbi:MAG: amidohydrolase family protein [Brevundimonas diminuta]|jgi:imidazolonepropionase-like amidohydrolase|uniref:Imidazolonepropionase n=2 Tax=Brevundimonas TaxID=41275 RepID=A0A1Z3LX22_BREDI|nr:MULTISPECIES: amidohydrolase family protein [Brevundimonas]ASD26645.1 imidazolonepropionase [Brevundimonas diminuta]MBI2249686.1 amidohydrolase family protein [Brevundimonas diminuta]OMG60149.1 imidazolonepropionase [Brevundimonas sp. ZS04]SPU42368.1 putative metallo-dependent hydrolase [Brevundimonas diminuta]VTO10900.1 putative metallo-dependent hydrolase [Brevundimonas vancanneytii]